MAQNCSICNNDKRTEIERLILQKVPQRDIAAQFNVSPSAVFRHKPHITTSLARTEGAREMARASTVLHDVWRAGNRGERLYGAAEQILADALAQSDPRTALSAIKSAVDVLGEARAYLELRGELTGEIRRQQDAEPEISSEDVGHELQQRLMALLDGDGPTIDIAPTSSVEPE